MSASEPHLILPEKGSRAFGETEKIASTPRPGIEPGPPANAAGGPIIIIFKFYLNFIYYYNIIILLL